MSGEGLVFNPGERVEGYSNLLYVLLVSAGLVFLNHDQAYGFSVAINLLLTVLTYLAFLWIARRTLRGHSPLVAVALFSLTPSVWIWTGSGMETPLVLLLVVLTWGALEVGLETGDRRAGWALGALAAVAVLSRADGFLIPLFASGFCLLRGQRRLALAIGGAMVLTLALLVAWRLWYYGYPLPNTYYVKVSGDLSDRLSSGLERALAGGHATGAVGPPGHPRGLPGLGVCPAGPRALERLPFEACFGIAWVCYFVYVGGDALFDRFLVPIFPLGVLLALRWSQEWSGKPLATTRLVLLLVALGAAHLTPFVADHRMAYLRGQVRPLGHAGTIPARAASGCRPGDRRRWEGAVLLRAADHRHAGSQRRTPRPQRSQTELPRRTQQVRPGLRAGAESRPDRGVDEAEPGSPLGDRPGALQARRIPDPVPVSARIEGRPGEAIIDVSGFDASAIRTLRKRGYAYAVLERRP